MKFPKQLRNEFTEEEPFGPTASPARPDNIVQDFLFDNDNQIYGEMNNRITMVVGRRGSGKTSFLRSVRGESEYKVIAELPAQRGFKGIISSISKMSKGGVFVEEVSQFWKIIFWCTLFYEISVKFKKENKAEIYLLIKLLNGLGIYNEKNYYVVISKLIEYLNEKSGDVFDDIIYNLNVSDIDFDDAIKCACDFLEEKGFKAIILLDSLEDFKIDQNLMVYAISGLLKAQGEFHEESENVDVRICLPAELYHEFMSISSNPNKDFRYRLTLHWHAAELMRIACQRYLLYLQIRNPQEAEKFEGFELSKKDECHKFWKLILPKMIENRVGNEEETIAYILRHTQLLPRQFLWYLNSIFTKNKRANRLHGEIESGIVRDGVFDIEEPICSEIFRAFKYRFPSAKDACNACIPYLPVRFKYGDLHKVYNRSGNKFERIYEFKDFLNMLVEIGAIGRVVDETERYHVAEFEYTAPHHLLVSSQEELCIQPVFSKIFNAMNGDDKRRVVYPFGCDIDQEDYRFLRS